MHSIRRKWPSIAFDCQRWDSQNIQEYSENSTGNVKKSYLEHLTHVIYHSRRYRQKEINRGIILTSTFIGEVEFLATNPKLWNGG